MDLSKYWQDEQNAPQWFKDGNETWHTSEEEFLEFCDKCYKIYEVGDSALYVERATSWSANIHLSILRGGKFDIEAFLPIRAELLTEFEMVFGWVARQNRGLQKVCEKLGMTYKGVRMFHGESHGKVLEWKCYSVTRGDICVVKNPSSLLNLA